MRMISKGGEDYMDRRGVRDGSDFKVSAGI